MISAPTIPSILPATSSDVRVALQQFGRELAAGLWFAQAGTIAKFHAGPPQTADVTLNEAIVVGYQTNAAGATKPVTRPYPTFPAVPLLFAGGSGGSLTFPPAAGDGVLLVFLDRDLDAWWTSGQTGLPPQTNRLHSPSDAVAILGLRSSPGALKNFSTTDAQFYGPDGPTGPLVSIGGGKLGLGNASGQLVTALNALATALTSWVDTHGDTPNPATIALINAAKAEWDAILK